MVAGHAGNAGMGENMAPAWHHGDILEPVEAVVREPLAGYKVPKRIFARLDFKPASNGKADYPLIREFALAESGIAGRAQTAQPAA
jgi:hypothetical protein